MYITQENLLLTTENQKIGKLYKQKIIDMILIVETQGQELIRILLVLFPKKKKTCRRQGYQFHFGWWQKNSMINLLYETAESRNFFFRLFLSKTQHIWYFISQLIKEDFEHEYNWYMKRIKNSNLTYKFGIWECLAINYLFGSTKHRDWGDIRNGVCIIVPTGKFTGGNLVLYDFNIIIELRKGDFFALRSYEWYHGNEKFVGERNSYVLFTSI